MDETAPEFVGRDEKMLSFAVYLVLGHQRCGLTVFTASYVYVCACISGIIINDE